MKTIYLMIAIFLACGCTTLKPVELSPDELQEQISVEGILQVGDTVSLATEDGEKYKFKVTSITDSHIVGKDIEVPIGEIVAVKTKEFSGGKTAALAVGSVALMYVIGTALATAALLGSI